MNKKLVVIPAFAVALIVSNYWLTHRPLTVDIVSPKAGHLQVTILATGQVHTPASTPINSEIAGVVKQLAGEGQLIKPGELLALIEDKDAASIQQQAQASVTAAKLKLERLQQVERPQATLKLEQARVLLAQAQRQFDHSKTLAEQQQISAENLALAQETLTLRQKELALAELQAKALLVHGIEEQTAQSQLQQTQAQLLQADNRQQRQYMYSPFALTVLERKAEIGQYLKQGEAVLLVAPAKQQEVVARLDERWLPQLSLNQNASLVADAFPEQKFSAQISYIAPAVSDTRGTVEVRLNSPNWPAFLKEGMTVSLELQTTKTAQTLVIPSDLLQQNRDQYWVWLVKNDKAQKQNISIGQRSNDQVQVLSGLDAKAQLIKTDQPLQAGQGIRINSVKEF